MNYNNVQLAGNFVRDPQARKVGQKDTVLCTFTLAVQINKERDACFIDCVAWAKRGETIIKYFNKGSNIFVTGELETSSWTDKETQQKRSKTQLNVRDFQFTDSGSKSSGGGFNPDGEAAHQTTDFGDDDF